MVINAAIAIGLSPAIGWIAPAIATTVAGWAMLGLLYLGLRGMGDVVRVDGRYRKRLPRIVIASLAMGIVLGVFASLLKPALGTDTVRYVALLGLIAIGAGSYFSVAQAIGAMKLSDIRGAVRRS